MRARNTGGPAPTTTLAGLLALLLLAIAATEIAVSALISPLLSRLNPLSASILDAAFLSLLYALPLWRFIIRPLFGGAGVVGKGGVAPAPLCAKVLAALFVVEFLVMMILPQLTPGADIRTLELTDACVTVLFSGPFLWWLLFRPEMRRHYLPLSDLPGTPLKVYILLLVAIFGGDLLQESFSPLVIPAGDRLSHRIADAVLTTLLIAPFLWFLVTRPLQRVARFERSRAGTLHAAVLDAIVTVNPEGIIESFNPAAERIFGYTAAEITGKMAADLLNDDRQMLGGLLRKAAAGSSDGLSGMCHEFLGRRRDGSTVVIEVSVSMLSLDGDQEFLMIMRDISERKQLESALREREELFRSLSESAPVGVLHTDPEGCCLYSNQRWQETTGLSHAESLGTGWIQAIHPEDRESVLAAWDRAVTDGSEFRSEFRFLTRQGTERWVMVRAAAILSGEGNVIGYVVTNADISERKMTEQKLLDSLSLLAATLESTAEGILAVDQLGRVRAVNQKFLDMWRLSRQFVEGSDIDHFLAAVKDQVADPEGHVSRLKAIHDHPEVTVLDMIRFRDGRVCERYSQPRMLKDQVVGRVWSFRDITARTMAEDAVKESEARFRQVFEQTYDAIMFFKPGTCSIIDVNTTAEELYGYTKNELKEVGLEGITAPAEYARLSSAIGAIRGNDLLHLEKVLNHRKDGTDIIVSMRGKVMTLRGVSVIYCTFRDITERVRMEEEARNIQATLIQANKMTSLGLLVSGVAHEINNPNNFIMANAQLLAHAWEDALKILREYYEENGDFCIGGVAFSELNARTPKLFAGINDGASRINHIINNLKEFARQDSIMAERDVDVNEVAASAISILHHELVKFTDNFHTDLAQSIPPVRGNSQQLGQVMVNLLMNACQALPAKSHGVWLTTGYDRETGKVTITVRDEGIGMTRDDSIRIMEPFFTTKLDRGGTGLGLSICSSIVKEHHGTLDFTSEAGKGTIFTVTIPAGESAIRSRA